MQQADMCDDEMSRMGADGWQLHSVVQRTEWNYEDLEYTMFYIWMRPVQEDEHIEQSPPDDALADSIPRSTIEALLRETEAEMREGEHNFKDREWLHGRRAVLRELLKAEGVQ
jgi:hypothetical protein